MLVFIRANPVLLCLMIHQDRIVGLHIRHQENISFSESLTLRTGSKNPEKGAPRSGACVVKVTHGLLLCTATRQKTARAGRCPTSSERPFCGGLWRTFVFIQFLIYFGPQNRK
jgi:hypothetical protein